MSRNTTQFDDSRASGQCCVTASLRPGAFFVGVRMVHGRSTSRSGLASMPGHALGIGGSCRRTRKATPGVKSGADSKIYHAPSPPKTKPTATGLGGAGAFEEFETATHRQTIDKSSV